MFQFSSYQMFRFTAFHCFILWDKLSLALNLSIEQNKAFENLCGLGFCFGKQFTLYLEQGSLVGKTPLRQIVYFWIYKGNIFLIFFNIQNNIKKNASFLGRPLIYNVIALFIIPSLQNAKMHNINIKKPRNNIS